MKKIAIIGDYNQNEESHCLIMESIKEVSEEIQGELEAQWIMSDALDVSEEYLKLLMDFGFRREVLIRMQRMFCRQFNMQGRMGCLH